ncbi:MULTISPECIES: MFS transporter [Streptococcus]|uniref:MFS transporter n=1 Tax=Streptococcus TaxID=1301 RepID=UPI000277F108|nr:MULTISPECIES: MFS transporter [Streptococcus]EJO20790.1 transporter, major facilitator family protein [Streptococcus sp. BS35b]ETS89579.1 transporter, major facilitator domain protein [Streptococcus sp. BS29a]EUB27602.1 transporter, major facilitator domain protein [Streptococcus sp. BS21]MCY7104302.1 MFS transporter [Streptococcus oralis]
MKQFLERASILALSLVLITSFSISSALPAMFDYYQGYPKEQIELLVSLPSFGIMIMLVLNGVLERLFPERLQISLGLLILSIGGTAPFWYQEYNFVFAMRILFGLGVGMINAKAISIISERYHGKTRIQMLGLRGSAEVVGASILTLVVGQLLSLGWTVTFLAYSAGFLVLILYLLFVPYGKEKKETKKKEAETTRLTGQMKGLIFLLAVEAAVVVCTNTAITIRIPSLMVERDLGDAQLSSLVLSIMQLIGILAGVSFSFFISLFKERLLLWSGITFGLGQIVIALSPSLGVMVVGSIVAGFSYSVALTTVFQLLSERIPAKLLNQATSFAVLGCSFGAFTTPFILGAIGLVTQNGMLVFTILGYWLIVTSIFVMYALQKRA